MSEANGYHGDERSEQKGMIRPDSMGRDEIQRIDKSRFVEGDIDRPQQVEVTH